MQYACFLPMFRSHGTDAAREIWRFGDEGNPFYDAIAKFIRLRYQFIPYLYSLAAQVTLQGRAMLRAVALDFPEDKHTHNLTDQFLFGPALLVCPVTRAMYYEKNSQPIAGTPKERSVYLPAGTNWFDFWTDQAHAGGQNITAAAPLETMPLFVRAGSIVPMTEVMQFTDEKPDAPYEIRIYRGADGEFVLYEDAGDGYGYENGECATVRLSWHDESGELVIHPRQGSFPGMTAARECKIRFIGGEKREERSCLYTGQEMRLRLAP
jgi:alpha-D-xyloside xylohydrolase